MVNLSKQLIALGLISIFLTSCGGNKTNNGNEKKADSVAVDTTANESQAEEPVEEQPAREIEALVLTFYTEDSYYTGYESIPYKNNYKVTLHMNGDADIHTEIHYPNSGEIGKPSIDDYEGSWAQRQKLRGSNYVDYYDIEFNNSERDLNWCVDNDCKSIYFSWDAFWNRNKEQKVDISKVDTLYAK